MTTVQVIGDHSLIQLYLKGNESALETLIIRHRTKIYSSIYFLVRNRALAEDIFQDTFIKVIDTLRSGKYNEEGKFLPWVMRIAHNLCIDHFRRRKRMPTIRNSEGKDVFTFLKFADESKEDQMLKNESHEKVKELVEQLPDEQREVVILRHYADLSFKEIAKMTNVSINTALGRMRYGLINLRKMIEEKEISL